MTKSNQRTAYGEELVRLGAENKNIVVLDADLSGSTMGKLFAAAYPERHFEVGIAEANMTSIAAGLAQTGKIPFSNSFAVFAGGRAFDQIRQTIAIGSLNVKICGSSSGLSDFGDGATHQCIEDLAVFRSVPNMTVLCPADAAETRAVVRAMVEYKGPCYMRLNRNDCPDITDGDRAFVIGEPYVMHPGSDIVVFACGYMVHLALEAAESLQGTVSVRVVNVPTIKPLNAQMVQDLAHDCKAIVTAEEHSVCSGLGSTIAEIMRRCPKPMEFVGVEDTFGCSAHSYQDLLSHYQLTKEHIVEAIRAMV